MYVKAWGLLLSCVCVFSSCNKKNSDSGSFNSSISKSLTERHEIIKFDDKLLVGASMKDSVFFIKQRGEQYGFIAVDLEGNQLNEFGQYGVGPNDVLDPMFVSTTNKDSSIYIEDANSRKIMQIVKDGTSFTLEKAIDYPMEIYPSSNLAFSDNYIVGRMIDYKSKDMFFIYDKDTKKKIILDNYPTVEGLTENVNYFYASNLALNEEKKRIIAAMYFFDMAHIYDLEGNRMKTITFSDKYMPNIDKGLGVFDLSKGKTGFTGIFATNDFCYLVRSIEAPIIENNELIDFKNKDELIKMNWEGEVIDTYSIPDKKIGNVFVSDVNNKVYFISHEIKSLEEEFYTLVSYKLPN